MSAPGVAWSRRPSGGEGEGIIEGGRGRRKESELTAVRAEARSVLNPTCSAEILESCNVPVNLVTNWELVSRLSPIGKAAWSRGKLVSCLR
jgi:hypothetical protein